MENLSRRNILVKSLLSAGGFLAATRAAKAASCGLTPAQTEGPFYPIEDQADKDNDLTKIRGSVVTADGKVVILKGVVRTDDCLPVAGALVEIWQACATGKYNHPGDPNPARLDPNFQYWGRAVTNEKGEYSFKTIRPGQYQATRDWIRPAHIHLKVHRRGYEELTTQVYFKDDRLNSSDRILLGLDQEERDRVIVDFKDNETSLGIKQGHFDITLRAI